VYGTQIPSMPAPDWMTTTWQVLPRLARLLGKLHPTFHLPDVTAVDRPFLEKHGVTAVLWDVDGTLMAHHALEVALHLRPAFESLDLPQAILSNCGEERFVELGTIFPALPVLKAYRSAGGVVALRSLHRGEERWSTDRRPEGRLLPLKKPSDALIELALDRLQVAPRERALMVGDQYFTDIAGANLAGIRSAKVPTLLPASFPWPIRSFQIAERAVYRLVRPARG
jgi:predicted HAD superfamily phosphohydrolase YqeG